jgi:uncharacterized protein (DUF433 family)
MTDPSPGFIRALMGIVLATRPRFDATVADLWSALIRDLSDDESVALPAGLTEIVPLFLGDEDHLRLLVDLLVAFEIFEVGPELAVLARRRSDPNLLIAAAALAAHPGGDPRLADEVVEVAADMDLSDPERRAVQIRLEPSVAPETDLERILRAQVWPGAVDDLPSWLPPTVGVDEMSGTARDRWTALAVLAAAGLNVRRIVNRSAPAGWLRHGTPVLTWDTQATGRLHRVFEGITATDVVVVDGDLRQERVARALLRQLGLVVPRIAAASALPIARNGGVVDQVTAMSPDVYRSGALDSADMGVLAGGGRRALYETKDDLPPTMVRNQSYWSFNQLVALRTWQYFKSQTDSGRLSRSLLTRLSRFAGADDSSVVGVTATGHVLARDAAGYTDIESGQRVLEAVVALDVVFQPFSLGAEQVPSLLRPSLHTRVHPGTLGGTPAIVGHRIAVKSVALLAAETSVDDIANLYYPEVERAHLADAIRLGRTLLRA